MMASTCPGRMAPQTSFSSRFFTFRLRRSGTSNLTTTSTRGQRGQTNCGCYRWRCCSCCFESWSAKSRSSSRTSSSTALFTRQQLTRYPRR